MIKIKLKTENKFLQKSFKSIFEDLGLKENAIDILLTENENNFILNQNNTLSKPLKIKQLLQLLNKENIITINKLKININNGKTTYDDKEIILTSTEIKLLTILNTTKEGLSLKEILNKVFGYSNITNSKTYATHIYNLRKKLHTLTNNTNIIIYENNKYKINNMF